MRIQTPVDTYPMYTSGLSIDHPRCMIARNDSVDFVSGKKSAGTLSNGCIPSIGQIIPHSSTHGKNDPNAIYVAERSLSTAHEITNPENENGIFKDFFFSFKCIETGRWRCQGNQKG